MRTVAIAGIGSSIELRLMGRLRAAGVRVRTLPATGSAKAHDGADPRAVEELCRGADALVHAAAPLLEVRTSHVPGHRAIVTTRSVTRAARTCHIRRMIHLSSANVYGIDYPYMVGEDGVQTARPGRCGRDFLESEQVALRCQGSGLDVVVLRAGDVYGPGSFRWVVRPLQLMARGMFFLPGAGAGVMNHLYVDNLVDAVMLALDTPHVGCAYNLTDGAATTFADYFARLSLMGGHPLPPAVPARFARLVARGLEEGARLMGRHVPLQAVEVDLLSRKHPYSIERARQSLGFSPRTELDQGLRLTERWLRAEGILPRRLHAGAPARGSPSARGRPSPGRRMKILRSVANRAPFVVRR